MEYIDNFFYDHEEPELTQVSSDFQQGKENPELRLCCSCYKKPAALDKKSYSESFIEASQLKRRAALVGSKLKVKKALGCNFSMVVTKQLSGTWRVGKVAGNHDTRCYNIQRE
jgi:hypothetical protein